MTELGFKRRMPLVALALLACEQLKIPIGYGALPSDSEPSGGQTSSGGARLTGGAGGMDASTAGANDGGTSQGGRSGVGGEGGEPNPPGGAGGGPSTAPALWLFSSLTIPHRWCAGPSAVGTMVGLDSVGRWSPAEGVVPLVGPPGHDSPSPLALVANADCSVVATTFNVNGFASVFRWSGSEPGTIISTLPPGAPVTISNASLCASADLFVIASTISEGPASRLRLWRAGVLSDLAPPAGFSNIYPGAFNADGSVLFGKVSQRPIDEGQGFDTFRWTEATGAVALPELRGCDILTMARDGSRVFGWCGQLGQSAFVWRADTGIASLGEPSSTSFIYPEHSSVDGSTVTGEYDGSPGGLFVWRDDRGFEFVALSGGIETMGHGYASGMSADGRVIVGSVGDDETRRPIRWSASAGVSELEVLSSQRCAVSSLSADGRIAAGGCRPDDVSREDAVIWDSEGKIQRLDELLRTAGVDLKGAELFGAAVLPNGQFVIGSTAEANQTFVARLPQSLTAK